ncbi:VOC family protein [Kribbella sp. NPDC020789]
MASRLNPYIQFDGSAREAMEFYQGVLGGELTMSTFAEFGAGQGPEGDKLMHSQLETPTGFTLMASDTPQGMSFTPGTNVSISLSGDDGDLREYFTKLSEGGKVTVPLEKQMWGDEFGQFIDRFGISWLVNISGT